MKATRPLLVSCFLAVALIQLAQADPAPAPGITPAPLLRRQNGGLLSELAGENSGTPAASGSGGAPAGGASSGANTASGTTRPTTTPPTTPPPNTPTPTPPTSPPASNTDTAKETSNTNNNNNTNTNTDTNRNTQTTPPTPPPTQTSRPPQIVTTTDDSGDPIIVTVTPSDTATSPASSSTDASSNTGNSRGSSSGLGTGSIIGLSVAGGVAVLGIIGFFVWKFTRKRFSDFDDNEAIKWPELNTHSNTGGDSHPLPVNNTGRAGFDTGSEVSLSRAPSNSTHNFSSNYSTTDLGPDPYAVPPLPHLNPNQPYRDDPNQMSGYYDPYRGPIPNSFNDPARAHEWGGEAIPMTQLASGVPAAGRMSPGPAAAYAPSIGGRMSPGPGMAYDMGRGASPAPHMMQGRASPGPNMAYGQH
uniref:Uncharacterized protein n=1 Tax=Moniliophthora roreri TaxID=221103 RepID=A0A0W0FRB7_MONRR